MASPEMTARVEKHRKLLLEARASQQAGVPADSPQARDLAERVAADSAELVAAMRGEHDVDVAKSRRDIVEFDRNGKPPQWQPKATGLKLLTQYRSLVATINGTARPDPTSDRVRAAVVREWMGAALRQAP
ncbi:hypothetical protein OG407_02500 [Streptomyces sp. NBC_01515]|uniref:hypothetical protein n=1 Tax=Streptomyces sp. NBC_01515 TaxID=2903890 RepID=UPI00386A0364